MDNQENQFLDIKRCQKHLNNNMKNYSAYLDEISAEELYKGLLAFGLFSEKLPPIFTSEPFYEYCLKNQEPFPNNNHDYIVYEINRDICIPRQLGIPNPMAYHNLCLCLKSNWDSIKEHFHSTTDSDDHKISRIHLRKNKNSKALFEMNYNNWKEDGTPQDDLIIGSKFVVHADISTCFPSIYTHSLCWALMGKEKSKSSRDKKEWPNKLDSLCQKLHNGETHGLMIGPHASNLLSEIILTIIDKKLRNEGWHYIRNIDDYLCFVTSQDDAKKFISSLVKALREYDLTLNHKKTSIQELPIASVENWVRKLNTFDLLTSYTKIRYKEIKGYFDLAVELLENNNASAAVFKYAIKVLSKHNLTDNAKNYCIKECMHLALIYPYLLATLDDLVFVKHGAKQEEIECFSNLLYEDSLNSQNFEGICYSIFYALKYNCSIKNIDWQRILEIDNCLVRLFGYLYYKKQNNKEILKEFKTDAQNYLKEPELDRYWLYAYEILSCEELKDEWKKIKKHKVSFLKPEYQST